MRDLNQGLWCVRRDTRYLNSSRTAVLDDSWHLANRYVYLSTVPRSGNTWLRKLLEIATGLATTSMFLDDPCLLRAETGRNGVCSCGLSKACDRVVWPAQFQQQVLKSHFPFFEADIGFEAYYPSSIERVAVVVRNPVDNYARWVGFTRRNPVGNFTSVRSFSGFLERWTLHVMFWFAMRVQLTMVRFEDLLEHPQRALVIFCTTLWSCTQESIQEAVRRYPPKRRELRRSAVDSHRAAPCWAQQALAELPWLMRKMGYTKQLQEWAARRPPCLKKAKRPIKWEKLGPEHHWRDDGEPATGPGVDFQLMRQHIERRQAELQPRAPQAEGQPPAPHP